MQLLKKFKIGDRVRVINAPEAYTITGNGSIGTVTKSFYDYYRVEFIKMTGPEAENAYVTEWEIHTTNLVLDKKYVSNGAMWDIYPYYYPQAGINFLAGLTLKF